MEQERSLGARALHLVGFGLLALAITIVAGGVWSALLVTNLRTSPAAPWSVPVMALLLWLTWHYLGGKGWPRSTSAARRYYLRANSSSARTYLWSFAAGVLSVIALAGYWIVLFRLVRTPPNSSRICRVIPLTVALMILMGSLVGHSWKRLGFADIFRWLLEREFRGWVAVTVSALVFPWRTSLMVSCGQSSWCTFWWASRLARRLSHQLTLPPFFPPRSAT